MAQQCFMFLDWGDGWVAVNDHDNDVAALDGFSIQWGTDGIDQQPDPSVMTFRLRDSTGWLTGRALTLAGARVLVSPAGPLLLALPQAEALCSVAAPL